MPAPGYEAELKALESGLASGEATIESDGDRVTYRGVSEIMAAITFFERRAAAASGMRTRGSTVAVFERD
jgi:hypothetical protein